MNNTRKTWIDIARIFCMLIIVIGHMPCYEKMILEYLTTFHVAIFFILSGMLYHPQNFLNEVAKSFKSLIIPYIILGLVNVGYWGVIETYINDTPLTNNLVDFFIQLTTTSIGLPMIGPLWFLVVLFLLRVSFVELKDDKQILAINILSIIAAVLIKHFFVESFFYAPVNIFLAIPFFSLGYVIQRKNINYSSILKPSISKYLISALVFFVVSFILFLFQGGNNMSKHDFGNNIITFYICALFGTLWIINLSKILQPSQNTISSWLHTANNGLPLMIGLQIMMIDIVKRITNIYAYHIYEAIAIAVMILLLIMPITILCMKYCPWIIGRK